VNTAVEVEVESMYACVYVSRIAGCTVVQQPVLTAITLSYEK